MAIAALFILLRVFSGKMDHLFIFNRLAEKILHGCTTDAALMPDETPLAFFIAICIDIVVIITTKTAMRPPLPKVIAGDPKGQSLHGLTGERNTLIHGHNGRWQP